MTAREAVRGCASRRQRPWLRAPTRRTAAARLAAVFLAGIGFACSARADVRGNASAAFEFDDNLPRARRSDDRQADAAFVTDLDVARSLYQDGYDDIAFGARVSAAKQVHYDGLDHVNAGIDLEARHKFGLGREVPVVRVSMSATREEYDDAPRDGWAYAARLDASVVRFARVEFDLHYTFERKRADHASDIALLRSRFGIDGDAFSTDAQAAGLSVTYAWNARLSTFVDYSHRFGDLTSTSRLDGDVFEYSKSIAPDPVFGAGRIAYRVFGRTDLISVGVACAITNAWSLTLAYRHASTSVDEYEYRDEHATLSLNYRF